MGTIEGNVKVLGANARYVEMAEASWDQLSDDMPRVFRCSVNVYQEDNGYCVYAADLPGVVSEGNTESDALENIKEAYTGVIQSYWDDNEEIPWKFPPDLPREHEDSRTIEVEVGETSEC